MEIILAMRVRRAGGGLHRVVVGLLRSGWMLNVFRR